MGRRVCPLHVRCEREFVRLPHRMLILLMSHLAASAEFSVRILVRIPVREFWWSFVAVLKFDGFLNAAEKPGMLSHHTLT